MERDVHVCCIVLLCLCSSNCFHVVRDLFISDTLGAGKSVPNREVSFHGSKCTVHNLNIIFGTAQSVLIREVSMFKRCVSRGVRANQLFMWHYIYVNM